MQRRTFLLSTAALAVTPAISRAAGPQPLFNGKDLSGWHIVDGPDSAFYVEDGAICASPSSGWPA